MCRLRSSKKSSRCMAGDALERKSRQASVHETAAIQQGIEPAGLWLKTVQGGARTRPEVRQMPVICAAGGCLPTQTCWREWRLAILGQTVSIRDTTPGARSQRTADSITHRAWTPTARCAPRIRPAPARALARAERVRQRRRARTCRSSVPLRPDRVGVPPRSVRPSKVLPRSPSRGRSRNGTGTPGSSYPPTGEARLSRRRTAARQST